MPKYRDTSCPYCSKKFQSAGPFNNHLRLSHAEHAGNFYGNRAIHRKRSPSLEESQRNSASRESFYLGTDDISDASDVSPEECASFPADSDAESEFEDVADELEDSDATRRDIYKGSGRSYGSALDKKESILDMVKNPWYSFLNASKFKLARLFIEANVS